MLALAALIGGFAVSVMCVVTDGFNFSPLFFFISLSFALQSQMQSLQTTQQPGGVLESPSTAAASIATTSLSTIPIVHRGVQSAGSTGMALMSQHPSAKGTQGSANRVFSRCSFYLTTFYPTANFFLVHLEVSTWDTVS